MRIYKFLKPASCGLAAIVLVTIFGFVPTVRADVNDFTINDFTGDYTLTNADPQGQMEITERLTVTFTDNNHGILRAIPESFDGHTVNLKIKSVSSPSGAPAQYSTYGENGNTVVKIGDPDRTITGRQQYEIRYRVENVIRIKDDRFELLWDINGDGWQQSFDSVNARLHLPVGVVSRECFTGRFGSMETACSIDAQGKTMVFATKRPLLPYETLTIGVDFAPGYFTAATFADWWDDYGWQVVGVSVPPLALGGWAFAVWRRKGRDLKGRGVIVSQYDAPAGLGPLESGGVMKYQVVNSDITAALIDLAIRGYLRIIETKRKGVLGIGGGLRYKLEVVKSDTSRLSETERRIVEGLFSSFNTGKTVEVDSLRNKFYKTVESVRANVMDQLTAKGYFVSNPRRAGWLQLAVGIVAVIAGASTLIGFGYVGWGVGLVVAGVVCITFSAIMPKRTIKGVEARDHLKGLKIYLEVAEADRIQMLQSPDARYASGADEPQRTVELFEKLLPYAMVLGVEKKWAAQFESIYITPPDWYRGNWTTFNAVYLASSLDSAVSSMNQAFAAPSSSGSGAGGGGGGGGGGGW